MKNVRVVNLVITSDLKRRLQLEEIACKLTNIEYNPEQFPGLVIRIKEPKISALLFTSGKVVCTGAKNITQAKNGIKKIIECLKEADIEITIKPALKIQNLVGTGELDFKLNLNLLAMRLNNVEYDPEQFPGLVYKIKQPFCASFLLFSNGKLVCTGTKSEEEMKMCLKQLVKNLELTEKIKTRKSK